MTSRRRFLTETVGGIGVASLLPHVAMGQNDDEPGPGKPKIVGEGEGTQVWAMGVLVTVKVKAGDTGGAYAVFEDYMPPGTGPVPHTHTKEDETIYVLEGKLRAWLGGKQYDLKAGDFVHMPRGVQHYFKNVSDGPTRMMLTYTPGGFEQWFLDVGKAATSDSKVPPKVTAKDIRKAVEEAQKYGVLFHVDDQSVAPVRRYRSSSLSPTLTL